MSSPLLRLHPSSPPTAVSAAPSRLQSSPPLRFTPSLAHLRRHPSHAGLASLSKNLKRSERDKPRRSLRAVESGGVLPLLDVDGDDEDGVCPVDCVREFKTEEELSRIMEKAKEAHSLVVVDFYRTSCGSCKYIEQGFNKLCKGSGDQDAAVIFLKHNVIDEYDEQSEVAERLRIKAVPLFQFYRDGVLLEAFPTRDKDRIVAAINKYAVLP